MHPDQPVSHSELWILPEPSAKSDQYIRDVGAAADLCSRIVTAQQHNISQSLVAMATVRAGRNVGVDRQTSIKACVLVEQLDLRLGRPNWLAGTSLAARPSEAFDPDINFLIPRFTWLTFDPICAQRDHTHLLQQVRRKRLITLTALEAGGAKGPGWVQHL